MASPTKKMKAVVQQSSSPLCTQFKGTEARFGGRKAKRSAIPAVSNGVS